MKAGIFFFFQRAGEKQGLIYRYSYDSEFVFQHNDWNGSFFKISFFPPYLFDSLCFCKESRRKVYIFNKLMILYPVIASYCVCFSSLCFDAGTKFYKRFALTDLKVYPLWVKKNRPESFRRPLYMTCCLWRIYILLYQKLFYSFHRLEYLTWII